MVKGIAVLLILISSWAQALTLPKAAYEAPLKLVPYGASPSEWHVGDILEYKMRVKPIPAKLNCVLKVTKIEKEGLTLVQEISFRTTKLMTVEMLMDRDTGQVKKTVINGKEQKEVAGAGAASGADTQIIKEEESHIKVEAGKKDYDCIYILTKSGEDSTAEAWLNPAEIPMSGLLKTSTVSGALTIEMELVKFAHGQ